MRKLKITPVLLLSILSLTMFFLSCDSTRAKNNDTVIALTPEEKITLKIDSIKQICKEGDLIVRLNDDMISEIIKQVSEGDRSFSHAGIIVKKNNQKWVCHILPDDMNQHADTIRYDPIDSFINPKKNLSCGLFRYDMSTFEIKQLVTQLDLFSKQSVHFDQYFNFNTDSNLYCSEMIAKGIQKATNNKIVFVKMRMPKRMIKPMMFYFKKFHLSYSKIEETPFISIASLYSVPQCKELIRASLKIMP